MSQQPTRPDWADDKATECPCWQDVPEDAMHWFTDLIREMQHALAAKEAVIEQADKAIKGAIGKTDDGYVICLGYHPPTEERDGEFEWLEVVPKSDRDTLHAELARCINLLSWYRENGHAHVHYQEWYDDICRTLDKTQAVW